MGRTEFCITAISTSTRFLNEGGNSLEKEACITYDKQKMNVLSWGDEDFESDSENDVHIDKFKERLYQVFKKGEDNWNQDDMFLLKAVSDFMRLLMKELIEESDERIKDVEELHHIFIIPSEWEEEMREVLLRPLFVQADLISKDDHKDRLLFCSELECICYSMKDLNEDGFYLERGKNTIVCRLSPIERNEILIKLDLVSTVNSIFDFPDAIIYPKVVRSNFLSLTIDNITDGIKAFIETELPFDIQEEIIQIIKNVSSANILSDMDEKDKAILLKQPLITDTSKWELNKHQEIFMGSICIFNICAKIGESMFNNVKDLLLNDFVKEYNIMTYYDEYSSEMYPDDNILNWSQYMLEYNRISFNAKNVTHKGDWFRRSEYQDIAIGALRYVLDVIRNSDINSKPRILPVQNRISSSSIFLNSKPEAMMNIDITAKSTSLSFSLLDENGFVKEIWDHDYFLTDKTLRSLDSFLSFLEITTLHVKYSHAEDLLVSTQQQIYIKTFTLLYMTYIKYIIAGKLSTIVDPNMNIQIGYAVSIEKVVLSRLFGTEEGLKDVIYASGLIQRDDSFKKLRIISQGKKLLPLIQQSLELKFPLKSFFIVARFYEDYVQLTLNQIVTEFSLDDDQEVIIITDKIIHIPNIYDSLCLNMWNNIAEDSSLIQLCDTHRGINDNDLLEIFTLENHAEFTNNFKQYISENNLSQSTNDELIVQLSISCNCKVCLTVNDIIEISFQPVLQNITSLLSASLINKEFFGKYWNIKYVFQLIHFNYNTQLQDAVIKMLKEITEDITTEQEVDTPHYVIPKILDQRLRPVLQQRTFLYKEFQVGALHHVYSDSYAVKFNKAGGDTHLTYKSNWSDTKIISIDKETGFLLFKKGDEIDDFQTNRIYYLNSKDQFVRITLCIEYYKLKTLDGLKSDGTIGLENISEKIPGPGLYTSENNFKVGQDMSVMVSIAYEADASSLSITAKFSGEAAEDQVKEHAQPMTLDRF
ncbi:hypothetical protein INT48_004668 [Thamnidium elegans]|uniref:Uncharacterized protein n=1 Tax=Thamnidium elegans TaxID=101142 RepID=A0A8H7SZG4_9FUNG|nr:hypothetical protein INT48_004668 [Thamnidium elegans]